MVWTTDIPIYRASVLFLVESTVEEAEEVFKKNKEKLPLEFFDKVVEEIEDINSCDGCVFHNKGNYYYIVFIRHVCYENVVHELFHLTNIIMYSRGVTYDEVAEPWAYLLGWLTQRFFDDYLKIKKELRKAKKEAK